ncbi:type II toxin-antitoxin system VapC family toxin [Methanobrevibacter sp.]|uniref:type II toxin-antitoxin system VapC family toxin n=1 Tax=Methanobrevibacter sp. TaxID=66852 RepID=UPI0026DF3800|nr:type II toxin-antitoxin system VapC family toxin [Methanobrevibacter sp.]MDO5860004.1 type II toxin-antitoxin system VapC family toxin [Methanobrevibacter sp.]
MYFLDTTFIVGLFVSNDPWHPKAKKIYERIKDDELIISKLVIAETITVLKNKLKTKDILEIYRNIPNIFKIIEDTNLFDEAMDEYVKYDSDISFFDAIYVTVMKKENIHELISFDEDFDRVDGIVRIH